MPLYNFRCGNEHTFEQLVKMGTEETVCPVCKQPAKQIILTGKTGLSYRFNWFES